ncbi:hypothetical protein, partial [Rossellomorea marisflavi]|uniref:hypothetical protein n=1 Tax=Rossellomorea marisflavi TaxID=189381 RepID=UPI0035639515
MIGAVAVKPIFRRKVYVDPATDPRAPSSRVRTCTVQECFNPRKVSANSAYRACRSEEHTSELQSRSLSS